MNASTHDERFPAWDDDRDLLERVGADGVDRVRVRRCTDVEVVIGRGGRSAAELDLAAIRAEAVPVRRRRGGGCAVVLDPGNLIVSYVSPLPGVGGVTSVFRGVTGWLCGALDRAGAPGVTGDGVSDLVQAGRKVGGSCIYRTRGLVYYSSTLLLDPDLDLVERLLPHPPREPAYRAGRPHRDFMGRLQGPGPDKGSGPFAAALRNALRAARPVFHLSGTP
jgi:lipoate-protein ligase A